MLLTLLCLITSQPAQAATQDTLHEKYQLVQVIVLSRHNIRAPFAGKGSVLAKMTDHKWHDFGVKTGHLTARGALMERYMGTYFRNYLQQEGLFPADYQLQPKEMFFYANSFQRTIATALTQAGIYSVHTSPRQLAVNVIRKYIELKQRGVV